MFNVDVNQILIDIHLNLVFRKMENERKKSVEGQVGLVIAVICIMINLPKLFIKYRYIKRNIRSPSEEQQIPCITGDSLYWTRRQLQNLKTTHVQGLMKSKLTLLMLSIYYSSLTSQIW